MNKLQLIDELKNRADIPKTEANLVVDLFFNEMSETLAKKITGNMLGMEKESIDSDVKDAIGEMANMIGGGARTKLNSSGFNFNITIPNVIVGHGHRTRVPADLPMHVIPFLYAREKMHVEFGVKKNG